MTITKLLFVMLFGLIVAACGGGGGDGSPPAEPNTLSGVAATGYPIANGTIQVMCAGGGPLNTTTSSTGAWQVTISGQTLPCAVEVSGGTINSVPNTIPYHSIATSFGAVNVTPLTDLMLANLAGTATPNIWFAGLNSAALVPITSTTVSTALNNQCAALSGLTLLCTVNPITTVFTPTGDNVMDYLLIALQMAMINSGVTYSALLNDAAAAAYTAPIASFNTALADAYTATTAAISATAITTAQSLTVGTAMTSFSPLLPIGGTRPYTYNYTGTLPTGLSFSASTGVVTGTPAATYATDDVVFSVEDANGVIASTTSTVSFTVDAAADDISATANTTAQSLTVGTAMTSFSPLLPSGGTTPYTYSYTGTLPTGLSFNASTGAVTGTPTAIYATADVVFSVEDANNVVASTTSTVSFTVGAASSTISATANTTAQSLTVGTPMASFSPLLPSGGTTPYTYYYTGILPAGLSFSTSTGAVTGTPNAIYASADVVFSVRDANNVVASTTSTVSFTVVAAAAGSLDTTFNSTGKVLTDIDTFGDGASAVAIQSDGKIVAAGSSFTSGTLGYDFALVRYNVDGSLDNSFGTSGKVTTDFGGSLDGAYDLAIQADGKIIAAGRNYDSTGSGGLAMARYNADGTLDTDFGTGGIVTTNLGTNDFAIAIALQTDGKIIVGSTSYLGFALARYTAGGTLDTTFGTGGRVTTTIYAIVGYDSLSDIAIQDDGKIVAVGKANPTYDFALVRYNTDGSLDTEFGVAGKVTTDFGGLDTGAAVAIQSDGKIVAAGAGGASGIALARYNDDGSLDASFGSNGKVITLTSGIIEGASAVCFQSDGKIVTAGTGLVAGSSGVFSLARYDIDGSLDTTFDTDGKLTTSVGIGPNTLAYDAAIQTDGKIVAAGTASGDFALVRYLP